MKTQTKRVKFSMTMCASVAEVSRISEKWEEDAEQLRDVDDEWLVPDREC